MFFAIFSLASKTRLTRVAVRPQLSLLIAAVCAVCSATANAQDAQPDAAASEAHTPPTAAEEAGQSRPMPETIGGGPEAPRAEQYTSPLQTVGIDLGLGSYALSAFASIIYLAGVYPFQALLGSSKVEPVMLWLLLPIAGPWMAQYERSVKDSPIWRGLLIGDAALQATGLVLGLVGYLLSGRREPSSERAGLEFNLGVAGCHGMGITIALRTR